MLVSPSLYRVTDLFSSLFCVAHASDQKYALNKELKILRSFSMYFHAIFVNCTRENYLYQRLYTFITRKKNQIHSNYFQNKICEVIAVLPQRWFKPYGFLKTNSCIYVVQRFTWKFYHSLFRLLCIWNFM